MRPASGRQMQNVFTIWRDSWTILYPDVRPRTEYISRRNNAVAYLHWRICKDHGTEITDKWYQHEPETVMHSKDNNITPLWDMSVNTDRAITANRPDIVVKDSVNSPYKLIDKTVPSDWNVALKEKKKKSKYKDLEIKIQRMWLMKTLVIPVVVGALGTCKEWDSGKHKESIRISHYDRDSKDLQARICANPQKGA